MADVKKILKKIGTNFLDLVWPSLISDFGIEILKEVMKDDKFWSETIFIAFAKVLKSKKVEMLLLVEFAESIKFMPIGEGSIAVADQQDFQSDPYQFIKDWLNADDSTFTNNDEEQTKKIAIIICLILGALLIVFIPVYLTLFRQGRKLNPTLSLLIQNIHRNTGSEFIQQFLEMGNIDELKDYNYVKQMQTFTKTANKIKKLIEIYETGQKSDVEKAIQSTLALYTPVLKKMVNTIFNDGGLWKGDVMDYIIADLIYARVKITYAGDKPTFSKREGENIIDWSNEKSRLQHPMITKHEQRKETRSALKNNESIANIYEMFDRDNTSKNTKRKARKILPKDDIEKSKLNFEKDILAIINNFTFKEFYTLFGVNLVVTGSNISTGVPVYFNADLTPSFPIVKAVRISSSFPILFKPIKIAHKEDLDPSVNYTKKVAPNIWVKDKDLWYKKNYSGWFIDGGLLNNFPTNAFNYSNSIKVEDKLRSPKNMLELSPNENVFALKLGGLEIEKKSEKELFKAIVKSKELFDRNNFNFKYVDQKAVDGIENGNTISILKIISKIWGSVLNDSMDGRTSISFDKNEQILRLWTGNISVLDLITKDQELVMVDLFSYSEVFKHFGLSLTNNIWQTQLMERFNREKKDRKSFKRNTPRLKRGKSPRNVQRRV